MLKNISKKLTSESQTTDKIIQNMLNVFLIVRQAEIIKFLFEIFYIFEIRGWRWLFLNFWRNVKNFQW